MARNPVQFQKGISLNAFLSLYGTEDQCFDALYQWRWPNGFLCPHCGHVQLNSRKLVSQRVQIFCPSVWRPVSWLPRCG